MNLLDLTTLTDCPICNEKLTTLINNSSICGKRENFVLSQHFYILQGHKGRYVDFKLSDNHRAIISENNFYLDINSKNNFYIQDLNYSMFDKAIDFNDLVNKINNLLILL